MELKGSFIVFSFLLLFGRLKKRWLIYLLMIVVFCDSYYLAFVFGLILGDLFQSSECRRLLVYMDKKYLIFLLIIMGSVFASYEGDGRNVVYSMLKFEFLEQQGIDLVVLYRRFSLDICCIGESVFTKMFIFWNMYIFGKISFSLYLIHIPIFCSLTSYGFLVLCKAGVSYHQSVLASVAVSLPIIMLVAYFMAKYIDDAAIKIARKISGFLLDK